MGDSQVFASSLSSVIDNSFALTGGDPERKPDERTSIQCLCPYITLEMPQERQALQSPSAARKEAEMRSILSRRCKRRKSGVLAG